MAEQDSWRGQQYRQKVIRQIEDAMRQAGNPTSKTSMEMENHVYQKAKSREEYLGLVARLILHVRDFNQRKEKAAQAQAAVAMGGMPQQMGIPGMPGPPQPSPMGMQMGQPVQMQTAQPGMPQDPINALQNLTKQGPGPQMAQGPPGQMGVQMPIQGMQQPGMPQQQRPPHFHGYQAGMQARPPMQQAGMQAGMRPQDPSFMMQQAGAAPSGMPVNQQQMAQAPQSNWKQSGKELLQSLLSDLGTSPQQMSQAPPGHVMQSQMTSQPSHMTNQGLMTSGQASQQGHVTQVSMPPSFPAVSSPYNVPSSQGMVPSPLGVSTSSSGGPVPSPAHMIPSPSPGSGVVPSPRNAGAPSPGGPMNTPGNPNSQGPTASPSSATRSGGEEMTYLEKWKQLQKYIEPLKRMINRINKDEDRKKDLNKMKNLLDILSDSSKRLPMATLLKCEQVLEKQDFQPKSSTASSTSTTTTTTTTTPKTEHMCQPLLDAVAQHIHSPVLNHTLQRTFGPAVLALHGPPITAPSPPAKRQRVEDDSEPYIPNVLQGEIARLDHRFQVNLHDLYHTGSKTVHLKCNINDINLPSVPAICVVVPENYPESSPKCITEGEEYDSTPFLKDIQKTLSCHLLHLPDKFSITALLDTWEMSIRSACRPQRSH